MSVVAIVNPTKVDDPEGLRGRLSTAADQYDLGELRWVETTAEEPGTAQTEKAVAEGASLVLAAGGDGTARAVATSLSGTGIPLGLLPLGTGNLLARNLEIPLQVTEAIGVAFGGSERVIDALDVSLGHGRRTLSLVMCGMGWDAAMMDVSEAVKARMGWAAYAVQAARTVRDHPLRLRVQVDDGAEHTYLARTCLIANVGKLVGGVSLLPESEPDDGLLEVLVFDPTTAADYARSSWGLLRGSSGDDDPSRTVLKGRKVVVTTHRARPRQIDGDLIEEGHGFIVRLRPQALTVRVP
jgi:diacylglycerol kinase family enzyme